MRKAFQAAFHEILGLIFQQGSPTTNQPALPGPPMNLVKGNTQSGLMADFIIDQMVNQCSGCIDPAIAFYTCIERIPRLPTTWAMLGLNATQMRIKTVEIFLRAQRNQSADKISTTYMAGQQDPTDGVMVRFHVDHRSQSLSHFLPRETCLTQRRS